MSDSPRQTDAERPGVTAALMMLFIRCLTERRNEGSACPATVSKLFQRLFNAENGEKKKEKHKVETACYPTQKLVFHRTLRAPTSVNTLLKLQQISLITVQKLPCVPSLFRAESLKLLLVLLFRFFSSPPPPQFANTPSTSAAWPARRHPASKPTSSPRKTQRCVQLEC